MIPTRSRAGLFGLPATFFGFVAAVAFSDIGDSFRVLALDLWYFELTAGREGARLTLLLATVLPALFLAPVAGAVADRFDLRTVFIVTTALRGILSFGLAAAAAAGGPGIHSTVLVAAAAIAGVFFASSAFVFVPRLVQRDMLPRANGILESTTWALASVGPALGAGAYAMWGPAPSFAVDGVSFLVTAALFARILPKTTDAESSTPARRRARIRLGVDALASTVRGIPPAARYLAGHRFALGLLLASYGVTITAGTNAYALIFLVSDDLGLPSEVLGLVLSWNGIVAVIAALTVGFVVRRSRMPLVFVVCLALFAVAQVVMGAAPNVTVLLVGVALSALVNAPYNIAVTTLFQTSIDDQFLGRVEGLDTAVESLLRIAVLLGAAAVVTLWGARAAVIASAGVAMILLVAGVLLMARRRAAATDAGRR
ncbi:MFS transporter [Microbacterium aquilitoris]|uniref:MFS transporter n=1 Tax=Microbacterium aquilitoris TaxID=3067307 RepID=UPI00288FC14A|nr:MFS transporter [Microbacterium sp. KSW2-22]MDT3344382.1 MFS transporter [Microbacterium sp. KSW2-22]